MEFRYVKNSHRRGTTKKKPTQRILPRFSLGEPPLRPNVKRDKNTYTYSLQLNKPFYTST